MEESVFHASASAWQVHNTPCTNNMIFNLNLLIELIFIIVYCSVCQTTPQIYTLSTHNSNCDLGSEFLHSKRFLTKNSRICSRNVQFINGNVYGGQNRTNILDHIKWSINSILKFQKCTGHELLNDIRIEYQYNFLGYFINIKTHCILLRTITVHNMFVLEQMDAVDAVAHNLLFSPQLFKSP